MKHFSKYLSAVLILIGAPLFAEEKKETWHLRVAAMDIVGELSSLWLSNGPGAEPLELKLNIWSFSRVIEYKGGGNLAFYHSAASASAKEPPEPVARVIVSEKDSMIVFAPNQKKDAYQAFVISDSDFPFGAFRLVNLSKMPVKARFADQKCVVMPGASQSIVFKDDQTAIDVQMYALLSDEAPRLIRQSRWSIFPTQRELVLLLPNSANGLVQFRHFIDSQQEKQAAE
jgi:hypothetical protein